MNTHVIDPKTVHRCFDEALTLFSATKECLFNPTLKTDEIVWLIRQLQAFPNPETRQQLLKQLREKHSHSNTLMCRIFGVKDLHELALLEPIRLLALLETEMASGDFQRIKAAIEDFCEKQLQAVRSVKTSTSANTVFVTILQSAAMFDFARIKLYFGLMSALRQ